MRRSVLFVAVLALVVSCLSCVDAPGASAAGETGIAGRVTDAAGQPVAGVQVYTGSQPWSGSSDAVTAADGTYRVTGLLGWSEYQVCFDPGTLTGARGRYGYVSQCFRNVPSIRQWGPDGTPVAVRPGRVVADVDAALQPAGGVRGIVRDRRGRRLAHVSVGASDQPGHFVRTTETAADGTYVISGLRPDTYRVCFSESVWNDPVEPSSPTGWSQQCSGSDVGVLGDPNVAVAAAAESRVDMTLRPGGAIYGRVLDDRGQPVAGRMPQVEPQQNGVHSSPSDADGNYSIVGLLPGTRTVCFTGRYESEEQGPGLQPGCWKSASPGSATPIPIAASQVVRNINVRLHDQPAVTGRVTDGAGAPVSGVWIAVDNAIRGQTGADGTYRVVMNPGSHEICFDTSAARGASPAGYDNRCWTGPAGDASEPVAPVVVPSRGTVSGIDVGLAAAFGLRVTVVDAHGTPLKNASVSLQADEGGDYNGLTSSRGMVTFTRVRQGDGYTARFVPAAWNATPGARFGYRDTGVDVALVRGRIVSARIVAVSNGQISGTVLGADGNPLESVMVTVQGDQYVPSFSTDANGRYAVGGLAPGTYTVCFEGFEHDATGVNRQVTGCYDHTTETAATPVVVQDGTEVTGIDGHLAFT